MKPRVRALVRTGPGGRVTREQRAALLEEFARSGWNAAEFARHYGLKYQTFTGWCYRRQRELTGSVAESAPVVPMVEVAVVAAEPEPTTPAVVVVELGGGARVELRAGEQVGLVVALVRALADAGGTERC